MKSSKSPAVKVLPLLKVHVLYVAVPEIEQVTLVATPPSLRVKTYALPEPGAVVVDKTTLVTAPLRGAGK